MEESLSDDDLLEMRSLIKKKNETTGSTNDTLIPKEISNKISNITMKQLNIKGEPKGSKTVLIELADNLILNDIER